MPIEKITIPETFFGYIENTKDALLIFEACKRGILPRVKRRLQDKERILIRSGTVFCFDEKESGIKRWTDGFIWSPSRILGNFLIYRQLQDKKLTQQQDIIYEQDEFLQQPELLRRQREKQLVGSLKNSFRFKKNGLIKKSISLVVDGVHQHIVSYYNKDHVLSGKLMTPSSIIELSFIKISPGLKFKQQQKLTTEVNEEDEDGLLKVTQVTRRNTKRKQSNQIVAEDSPPPYSNASNPSNCSSEDTNSIHVPAYLINDTFSMISDHRQISVVNHNICLDKNFSNTDQPHYPIQATTLTYDMFDNLIPSSNTHHHYCSDELQPNPYQHLYSSSSFHAVNHASIIPNKNNYLITANAFMENIDDILGWSEFELQM